MARITQSTSSGNYHLLIGSTTNFDLLIKISIEDNIFKLKAKYGTKEIELVDFFIHGSDEIRLRDLLQKY